MPANKNAMTRYKILDELLSDIYHNYTIDDLTDEVNKRLAEIDPQSDGVVRRTIEKDINYLEYEGPFCVEIERYSVPSYNREKQKTVTKRCVRYATPSFSIFKKEMSDDEKYLLGEVLTLLGQFEGLPNFAALEGLRHAIGVKNERTIISFTKNPLENSSVLGELFTAISQRQVIALHYRKFNGSGEGLKINVCPYLLKEYNRRWFLFATPEAEEKLLCFALDRIVKITPLGSHQYVDYDGDLNEIFDDFIGVTINTEKPLYKIVFWTSNREVFYVETKPIHDSQKKVSGAKYNTLREQYPSLKEGKFFSVECRMNYELIREFTLFGRDLVVLEPSEIKQAVEERIAGMYEQYQNL